MVKGTVINADAVPFQGYCGGCWEWGHKKRNCPHRMDVSALATPSTSIPASSGDKSVAGIGLAGAYYLPCEEVPYWEDPSYNWHCGQTEDGDWTYPSYDEERHYESFSVGGITRTMIAPISSEEEKKTVNSLNSDAGYCTMMLDSGSQSTAVRPQFAGNYGIDDSDVPQLWDLQDHLTLACCGLTRYIVLLEALGVGYLSQITVHCTRCVLGSRHTGAPSKGSPA